MNINVTGLTTHEKALTINLNANIYGTFAEIGAGQEVVRWFFRVGGAAGTVTKSMSAYDMDVSDAIYGKSDRYVSRGRLYQMLDHEFNLNIERLSKRNKKLFAFADTITTKSFKGNNEPHGWMGLKFQAYPGDEPSQIVLHVRMLDREAVGQQEALGIIGVNLLYAAFNVRDNDEKFIVSLFDELNTDRVQIDMIEFSGAVYSRTDNRLQALYLVKHGFSELAMFDKSGKILQPSEELYKKPVLIERGNFRPVTIMHQNIINSCKAAFARDNPEHAGNILSFCEITMNSLLETSEISTEDFLARADTLSAIDQPVIISKYPEFYKIASYLCKHTSAPIAFAFGAGSLINIMNPEMYKGVEGGFLEAMGKLFQPNVKAYVYPQIMKDNTRITAESFEALEEAKLIYKYLYEKGKFVPVESLEKEFVPYTSNDVRSRMAANDKSWQDLVPKAVVDIIYERELFGCKA